jgi:hypothetical protein
MKVCSKCKTTKEETEFHKQTTAKDGLHPACKSCHYERNKIYKKNNQDKISEARRVYYEAHKDKEKQQMLIYRKVNPPKKRDAATARAYVLMTKFNLTLEQYNDMLNAQNSVCAICKQSSSNGRGLSVDHNHSTNKVRELLCHKCNTSLGLLNEDITTLLKMVEYLQKHS